MKMRLLSSMLTVVLLASLIPGGPARAASSPVPFWDVVGGSYEQPVRDLHRLGVISGTSETTFSPNAPVTRAQMAALVIRALKLNVAARPGFFEKFTDVPSTYWAFGEVMLAEQLGIVRGVSATEFQPNATVTYPQGIVMALRALGYDNGFMAYPTDYVLLAKDLGLIDGLNWVFDGQMTRGEVAVLLANAVFKVQHKEFGITLSQKHFRVPTSLSIQPESAFLAAGTTQLKVTGMDAYNQPIATSDVTWSVTSGSGSVNSSGVLQASSGSVTVLGTSGDVQASWTYQVVSSLTVTPAAATVQPGDVVQLKAVDKNDSQQQLSSVVWSVQSGPASVSPSGAVTVTGSGTVVVQAALGSITETATITAITGLVVDPPSALAAAGETVKFTVKRPDGTPFLGPVKWTVEGSGAITPDGTFTAAGGTTPTIKATAGSVVGTATVRTINRLSVQPGPTLSVLRSKTVKFTAKGITSDAKEVDLPITWSTSGRVGIIGADGTFVATASGNGEVVASFGSIKQTVSVSVSGDPYQVTLSATRSSVPANGRSPVALTATLKDVNGITVSMDTPIQFLLSDATKGTLSAATVLAQSGVATTTFTPSTAAGSFTVTAAAVDLAVQAGVKAFTSFLPVATRIRLNAYPNPIAAALNSRSAVTATLLDNEGYEIVNNTGSTVTVTLSFINTTAAGVSASQISILPNQSKGEITFTAGNAGDTLISGVSNYLVDPVTVKTMVSGPASKVVIRQNLTETKADGAQELVVSAEIQDANGVVRTQDSGTAVSLSATNGNGLATPTTMTTVTQSGIATFRVRHTVAGTFDLTASAAGLTSSTATGTFVPGAVAGLKLLVSPTSNISADATSTVKLVAQIVDANNNLVPSALGTISFVRTVSGNATTLPPVVAVPAIGGQAEMTLTATVYPGVDTFKATMVGSTDSATVTVTSRITGVPSKAVGEVLTASAAAGASVDVKVYVQDSQSFTVTGANGRVVRVVPDSPTAKVTGSGLTTAGVAQFTVTDTTAGVVKLSITSDGLISDTTKAIQFNAGAAAQIKLKLSGDEMSADNGLSYTQLTAEVLDAYGNSVPQAIPVNLTVDRTDVVTLSGYSLYTGSYVFARGTNVPGTVTITGTSSVPVIGTAISTFIAGAPARARVDRVTTALAGTAMSFRIKIIDVNGHAVTSLNTGTTLSSAGVILTGSAGNTQTITNINLFGLPNFQGNGVTYGSSTVLNGVASFSYFNSKAETLTVTPVVYYGGVQLVPESGNLITTPGVATQLSVTPARRGLSSVTSETSQIEAVLKDSNGNTVASTDGDAFNFSFSTSAYLKADRVAATTTSGSASIQVTSTVHATGGSTTITVTSTKTGLSGSTSIVTDKPPMVPILFGTDSFGFDTTLSPGDNAARVVITTEVRNTVQTVVAYVNGVQVNLYASASGGAQLNTIPSGQTTLVAYLLRTEMGGNGQKSIRVVVQNDIAPSPMSNAQILSLE